MASIEELLNSKPNEDYGMNLFSEQEEYCMLESDTSRVMVVPERYSKLGVESDEKAERIKFKFPKIVGDNKNLTQFSVRVNYRNANGETDQYICQDIEEAEGEYVTFSWELWRKVTKYKGTVNFIVCAVKAQDDGTITNEWNTTLAQSEVLEGLEVDTPEPTEEQSDVIAQLMQMVQNTSAQAVQAVQAAEQTAIENISELPKVENHVITFSTGG